jgi:dTDP-4-amino-4,6-dideoxygalactose transaminase
LSELALLGGPPAVTDPPGDLRLWPIITGEDEAAVLEVLRGGARISNWDVSLELEQEFARWQGTRQAITYPNGTSALRAAMFGLGLGVGDEIIAPSITFWGTVLQSYSLGATPVFADIDPLTLCIDPADVERRITDRTKVIVVVHYCGHPVDMDAIMEIARRRKVTVLEDVSHAHGGLCKGQRIGSFGDASAASLMAGKSLIAGEGGLAWTDDGEVFDRIVAWGHYNRFGEDIATESLRPFAGLPLGGTKGRLNQMSAALCRVQLKYYDERCEELRAAINYFWDQLEGVPGVRAHRVDPATDSNMAGWYSTKGHYLPEELGGLSVSRFCEAVRAEGGFASPGCNKPLHQHRLFQDADVFGHGRPTRVANTARDFREGPGELPVSEIIGGRVFTLERFVRYRPEAIDRYVAAFKKVVEHYEELIPGDAGKDASVGGWSSMF